MLSQDLYGYIEYPSRQNNA